MKLDLPEFDFEKSCVNTLPNERLFEKVKNFLDTNAIDRNGYSIGNKPTGGFGELVIQEFEDFWVVFTTERGTNFDVAIFSNKFHAVNYFIYRLTGQNKTIDWSTL